jgi:tetratricopeptide (TPR) repeat protein
LIDRDAGNALAHNDMGILYYEAGENDNALAHYQEAVRLSPENPIFQKNLGDLCWFVYGNAQAAMTRYMEALKLEPQDVEALLACSQICMNIGRNGDAREFLDCVLTLEPWNEEARQMINRIETADSNENDGPDRGPVNPTVEPQNDLTTQNVQASIDDLLQTITESPQDARAFNDLGVLYFESGDKDRALHCYEQAVSLQPGDAVFVKNLADFYLMEQGRIEDALKMYVSVLEDNPQDVDCLISTGLICRINGRPDDALDFYKRALEIEPWNQSAREALDGLTQVTDETLGQTGFSQATA